MGLTIGGWIFFIIGWGLIGTLTVYCFSKVLRIEAKKSKNISE